MKDQTILPLHLAWNEAERLNQTTTTSCECGWGPVTDCAYRTRREFRAHMAEAHPERKSTRKARVRPGFSMSQKTLEQNLAESRKTGATSWEGAAA
jgi:hypothetical protein